MENHSESTEDIIEELLVNFRIKIPNKHISAHIEILSIGSSLVDTYGLAIELNHIHDLDGVVSILFAHELHKAVALVQLRYAVLGHVHIHHRSCLEEQLP